MSEQPKPEPWEQFVPEGLEPVSVEYLRDALSEAFAAGAAEERKKLQRALPEEAATVQAWCVLRMERDRALARVRELEKFSHDVVRSTVWGHFVEDIDGGDLQELALRCNVMRPVKGGYDPSVHGDDWASAEPGDPWFELVAWAPLPEMPEVPE